MLGGFFLLMYFIAVGKTARFGLKKFAALGALTYPLYLLHQNLGYLLFQKLGTHVEKHVLLVGLTGLMIAAACWVHRSIECRYGPRLRAFLDGLGRWKASPPQPFTVVQSRLSLRESGAAFAERKATLDTISRLNHKRPIKGCPRPCRRLMICDIPVPGDRT